MEAKDGSDSPALADGLKGMDSPTLGSWTTTSTSSNLDHEYYLHPQPSPAFPPPSPFRLSSSNMASSHLSPSGDWSFEDDHPYEPPISPSSAYIVESPSAVQDEPPSPAPLQDRHTLSREVSEDDSLVSDSGHSHSSPPSQKIGSFPDPSQYPDPYPSYRPPRWQHGMSTPALSSADSSTASTRSSAYTNSARSGDYGHVHVALGGPDDPNMSTGISTEDVAKLLARESGYSSSQGRSPHADQSRWSDLYAQSVRSRSSSVGNGKVESVHESSSPALHGAPSFDRGWEIVDERDEMGLTSEEETDDDVLLDDDEDEEEEQPTSAMMIAEEGRGVIVRGGDGPIVQLQVHPGTTHLLIGSSSTPNAVPSFLTNAIPNIAHTLLALDISANFLVALPPALQACVCLEELNIASNPLRALPVFLAGLTSLRVLIADSTGLSTLPPALNALDKLHSLSVRRNKMNSLPSWLCLLPSLETLLVDGNPFQGPWKALVDPLLAKIATTPLYPLSTPIFPLPSASVSSVQSSAADTDVDESSESPGLDSNPVHLAGQDEDTIMPPRAAPMMRSVTSPVPGSQAITSPSMLSRTRTTPNRAYYDKSRITSRIVADSDKGDLSAPATSRMVSGDSGEREVRKMKSAGELRRNAGKSSQPSTPAPTSPQRPALSHYATSASSSNLLATASMMHENQALPKRFASLGVSSALSSGSMRSRPAVDHTIWDDISAEEASGRSLPPIPDADDPAARPSMGSLHSKRDRDSSYTHDGRQKEETKPNRWGFLKKMSMGKMRSDSSASSRPSPSQSRMQHTRPPSRSVSIAVNDANRASMTPQIDVRISTTGSLLHPSGHFASGLSKKASAGMLRVTSSPTIPEVSVNAPSNVLLDVPKPPPSPSTQLLSPLSPTAPTPRTSKRRSFLPIDVSPIPIPAASTFLPGVTATNGDDTDPPMKTTLSPIITENMEQIQRKDEERAREARTRALRSVMAYLRDMYDLGLSQQPNTMSVYGGSPDGLGSGVRSRRPTVVDNGRMPSETSISSNSSSRSDGSSHLRSVESRMALRSMGSAQTNSVATVASADSSGSGEERKYKDDKSKRARILREIVETERTYVKGLQELVDIYIKPAAAPVSALGSVGQSTVPSAERKIVFGGLESLFSFHKQSFLPLLERAIAPIMHSSSELAELDPNGSLSLDVARAVAHIFVSHAAFMKMYSTYINNFDNSVQRIRTWMSDKSDKSSGHGTTLSPSSSSAQLVGLGLTISAVTTPGNLPEPMPANITPLTSGQRKRIKAYLKRCRMNPRHSQLNLEGYLLLPVQRIPRYRLLLEDLVKSCPPLDSYMEDPLDRALAEISSLATNMNEGKRESESRRKLVQWQARIRGKFPSPLVQPHRRLIMDGPLHLTRVVRKETVSFEVIDSKGDSSTVQVECLSPELTPRSLIGILCNDLLVLCRDPSDGHEPNSQVDLWAVLRMQTLPQPASIVHGNALRLVDNKAILYFDTPSTSDALNWFRAINLHIPASKA